ncbi:MAG TPA: PfkB family carbohydrate kinase [Geobacteraceae bacterium]|nr:PfkB family carbohydrate kinase [Geobacteraceae bacterium]
MRVVGIGQCSWDYLATLDTFPAVDTKKEVGDWQEQGGGPVATALVALSRLGISCNFHGAIGDDPEGRKIRESLHGEGVETAGLMVRKHAVSQKAFIAIERGSAKRTIFWQRPTGTPLLAEELPETFLDDCGFLLLDGLMADVSLFAARTARKRGIPVMLDAGKVRPGMLEVAAHCDYVVASEQFALDLGWDGIADSFREEAGRLRAPVVTITLGERGSITFQDGDTMTIPAFPVDALDTTGAGDVFHGGYIFGLLHGLALADTIRFASAAAAMNCTGIGGRSGIPGLTEALDFLATRGFILQLSR